MKRKASTQLRRKNAKKAKIGKQIKATIYKMIKAKAETKNFTGYATTATLSDRSFFTSNFLHQISQGTSGSGRIGDKMFVKGISIKGIFQNSLENNVNFHVAFVQSDIENNAIMSSSSLSNTDFMSNTATHANNWRLDPEKCKIILHKNFYVRDYAGSTKEKTLSKNLYFKINKNLTYKPNGYFLGHNYYVLLWASVPGGGLNFLGCQLDYKIYFKDL